MEKKMSVCRTCLASSVKLYKLEDHFMQSCGAYDAESEIKVNYSECLNFCTRLSDEPKFPQFICEECSYALQISYYFIRNAKKANDILSKRLGVTIEKDGMNTNEEAILRFRCKICSEKVGTKKALKEHIKLHLDVITYACRMCDFDCKKRSQLSDHYIDEHQVEATSDQLKPNMQSDSKFEEIRNESASQIDEIFEPSEQRQREQEEAELLLQEIEEKLFKEKEEQENKVLPNMDGTIEESKGINILIDAMDIATANFDTVTAETISQNFQNDVSVGNEFVVLPDGTVQKVVGSDVVIEYINHDANGDAVLDGNNMVLENLVQMDGNTQLDSMDFEDIIEEAPPSDMPESYSNLQSNMNEETLTSEQITHIPIIEKKIDIAAKILQCKICGEAFETQSKLKNHMLDHAEIPHFFCDRCSFYTFFQRDLIQHYKTEHNLQPSQRQLQPSNKTEKSHPKGKAVFSCDLCLYETDIRLHLRRHYVNVHEIQATEVQLRPMIDNTDAAITKSCIKVHQVRVVNSRKQPFIQCVVCKLKFYSSVKYDEHMKQHHENQHDQNDIKVEDEKPQSQSQSSEQNEYVETDEMNFNPFGVSNNSLDDMILPMDEVPQEIASEQTVEHTIEEPMEQNTNYGFNGDDIFKEFCGNNNSSDDDDRQEDDDIGDLYLTSEDDLDDLLEEHGNDDKTPGKLKTTPQLRAYCVHCNKRFFSQYHFENHMFIHRGLAPFRCEMCTNLYNTKRALIRHYKAVHKTIPTRDMIQAKGDKVNVEKTLVAQLNLEGKKRSTLMCAKCPFESDDLSNLLGHLSSGHGIKDDNYILQKLPFECPQCVRSYDSKATLTRHLERNHSAAIITHVAKEYALKKNSIADNSSTTNPRSGKVYSTISKKSHQNPKLKMLLENDL